MSKFAPEGKAPPMAGDSCLEGVFRPGAEALTEVGLPGVDRQLNPGHSSCEFYC